MTTLNERFGALRSLISEPYASPALLQALLTQAQADAPARFASEWEPYLTTHTLPVCNITGAKALKHHALTCLPLRLCDSSAPLTKKEAAQLAGCPALKQVRELCFSRAIEPGALEILLKSPHLGALEVFIFKHDAMLNKQDAQRLAQHPVLSGVHTICFMATPRSLSSGHILLSSPLLTRLERLIWLKHSDPKAPASLDAWSILEALHQRHPLTHLSLLLSSPSDASRLAQWSGASSARSLDLRFNYHFSEDVIQVFERARWPHLESLFITSSSLNAQAMDAVLTSDFAPQLRALAIAGQLDDDASARLFGATSLTALTHLNLGGHITSSAALSQIAGNETFSSLERLDVGMVRAEDEQRALNALLEPCFALRALMLRASCFGGHSLAKLLSAPQYQRLEQLDLSQHSHAMPELFEAFAHRAILPTLRVLTLTELPITLEHLGALRQWAHIGGLRDLDLSDCFRLSLDELLPWIQSLFELSLINTPHARLRDRLFSFVRDLPHLATSLDGLNILDIFTPNASTT